MERDRERQEDEEWRESNRWIEDRARDREKETGGWRDREKEMGGWRECAGDVMLDIKTKK